MLTILLGLRNNYWLQQLNITHRYLLKISVDQQLTSSYNKVKNDLILNLCLVQPHEFFNMHLN